VPGAGGGAFVQRAGYRTADQAETDDRGSHPAIMA
jgi:hypothetical protein